MTDLMPFSPEMLHRTKLRVRYLSLALAGFALATAALFLFVAINTESWALSLLVASNFLVLLAALSNVWDVSHGELGNIWRMVTIAMAASFVFSSFFVAGMGLWYGFIAILLMIATMAQLPRERIPTWAFSLTVLGSVLTYVVDIYWPLARYVFKQPWLAYQIGVLGAMALLCFIFSFYGFGSRPLRVKLAVIIALVSVVTVLPVAGYLNWSNRQVLTERENSKLLSVAEQAAVAVDQFMNTTLKNVEIEASFDDLSYYLFLPPVQRGPTGYEKRTLDIVQSLARRDEEKIVSYAVLDINGTVLVDSSNRDTQKNFSRAGYFIETLETGKPQVSPVLFETESRDGPYEAYLYFTAPIKGEDGAVMGMLRLKYAAAVLQDILETYNNQAGRTSFAILVDENHLRLGHGRDLSQRYQLLAPLQDANLLAQLQSEKRLPPGAADTIATQLPDLDQKLRASDQQATFVSYVGADRASADGREANAVQSRVAVYPLKTQNWKVIFSQEESVTLQPLQRQAQVVGLLVLGIGILLTVLSFGLSTMFLRPVLRLTDAAAQIAQGNLDVSIPVQSEDEFGLLSRTFNDMAAQVRQSVTTLESRVIDRTRDLELRAFQLQVAAETGSIVSTIRDMDKLLPQVTELLSDRFGFYHVGIFLLDDAGEYAVLQAANSQGGRRMLARGHRLVVGGNSIVGYVSDSGQPRVSLNVGEDATYFNNPDLPNTHSEMALPLIVRGKVLGVLDLQSDQESAFSDADVTILRLVADQVAIAIENARLFVDLQTAIEATRRAYGEVTARAWLDYAEKQAVRGYLIRSSDAILPVADQPSESLAQAIQDLRTGSVVQLGSHTLAVPIKFRDLVLGAIRLQKDANKSPWVDEEIVSIQNLADQLGAALENARLYRETQRAASRDRMVREIGDKMRRAPDMDTLIQTAVREMARTLGVNEAFAQVSVETFSSLEKPSGNGSHPGSGEKI
ncbi:MAG: GAF domain-containing protein [Chloroflexota bacterium]